MTMRLADVIAAVAVLMLMAAGSAVAQERHDIKRARQLLRDAERQVKLSENQVRISARQFPFAHSADNVPRAELKDLTVELPEAFEAWIEAERYVAANQEALAPLRDRLEQQNERLPDATAAARGSAEAVEAVKASLRDSFERSPETTQVVEALQAAQAHHAAVVDSVRRRLSRDASYLEMQVDALDAEEAVQQARSRQPADPSAVAALSQEWIALRNELVTYETAAMAADPAVSAALSDLDSARRVERTRSEDFERQLESHPQVAATVTAANEMARLAADMLREIFELEARIAELEDQGEVLVARRDRLAQHHATLVDRRGELTRDIERMTERQDKAWKDAKLAMRSLIDARAWREDAARRLRELEGANAPAQPQQP